MAELQINKKYVNEAELGGDLFRQTSFYSDKALQTAFDSGMSFDLGKIAFENRNRDLTSIGISMNDYNYLSGLGQMTALETAFVLDPTATDKTEKGKEYNIRDANIEFLKAEIQNAKNQEINENTHWFVKAVNTWGAGIANFFVEAYGAFEGVLDAAGTIINLFANDDSITEWIAKDKTGYKAAKEALNDFNARSTFVGQGGVIETISTIFYDVHGLAGNLAWVLVPGVGAGVTLARNGLTLGAKAVAKTGTKAAIKAAGITTKIGRGVYWTSMGGHTAQQAAEYSLNNDADLISGRNLAAYTTSVMGVEFLTEMAGGKLFGGSVIDRLVLGKLAQPSLRMGTKLSTKSAVGAILYRSFGDILGEGVEEMAAEWAEGLLYSNIITRNPEDQASFGDILYAGLLGGIMGGVVGNLRTATTKPVSVTGDGQIIQTDLLTDEQKKNAVQLTQAQTMLLSDNLFALEKRLDKEQDFALQAREGKISQENVKELTDKQNRKLVQTAAGLSNFFANLGDETFKKSFNLLYGSIEQQAQSIRNFANRSKPQTKIYKELVEEYNRLNPTKSIDIVDTPSIVAQRIQKYIESKFGVNVLVMKAGAQDGINEAPDGITINEYTIGFREDALIKRGVQGVLNDIIAHELGHTLAFTSGTLSAKNLLQVKRIMDDSGLKTTKTYKALKPDLTEIAEAQADAIAQSLIFDNRVVEKVLFGERNIFIKVYNWMKNSTKKLQYDKRDSKNYEIYKTLLKRMAAYRKIVAQNIGNKEDVDKYIQYMSLTDIEIKELVDTYLPTWRNENCSITKYNLNTETLNKMTAINYLASMRKNKNDDVFDFAEAFNPEYYDVDFVNDVMEQVPNSGFKEALQSVVLSQTGYVISNDGWVIDASNVINSLNEDFINDLTSGEMLSVEKTSKYPTLHQLLKPDVQRLFVGSDGSSATEVRVIFKNSGNETSFDADYNYVTKELTITIPQGDIKTKIKRAGFELQLHRCVSMAIADVHSFYGGLVPVVIQQSLSNLTPKQFERVSKRILTDEFLAIQTNKQELIDAMMFKIVELTTTQRTLDDVSSGFITNGATIQGYGDFYGINFNIAGAPNEATILKTLRDINNQQLNVAYKLNRFSKDEKYNPAKVVEGQLKFEMSDKDITKEIKPVTVEKKETPKKKTVKTEQVIENVSKSTKAPNDRVAAVMKKIIDFKFSKEYVSQIQKMDKIESDDKTFDVAVRREFLEKFDTDLIKMQNNDVLYYLDYYKHNIYDLSVSSRKVLNLLFEYVWNSNRIFNKKVIKEIQKFLTESKNLAGSSLSTFGHLMIEAHPLMAIERQMLQEYGVEFTIPQHIKDRWIEAARLGDIETQTQVEFRAKEMGRSVIQKLPSRFNFLEKGITKEERKKRFHNFIDKVNAYRYLAMLSNPATHIRNIVGNYGIKALSRASEGFEQFFNKFIEYDEHDLKYLPDQKVSKEDIAYVEKRFKWILESVSKVGKYDTRTRTDAAHIMDNLKTEEIFGTKVFKWLQNLIYDKSLSKMDAKISQPELARTLTQLLVANYPEQFEYDKAHYDNTLGELFNKIRPFEDLIEQYDSARDAKEAELLSKRDAAQEINDTKTVNKMSYELGKLSNVYLYVSQHIDKIDVNEKDQIGLKGLLNCKTEKEAKAYMRNYNKEHKNKETLPDVKKQIKKARDILQQNGLSDDKLTTLFEVATRKVLTNYLRYENRLFKAWCKLMDDSIVMKILGSVFMPFAKVVTNMTLLTIQYSPLTLARGIKNMIMYGKGKRSLPDIKMDYGNTWHNFVTKLWYGVDDVRFVKAQAAADLGKGTVGTLLLLLGLILAELGIIDRDEEDDKYGGYVLHVNVFGEDIKIKLSDLAPSMTPLLAGVALTVGARDKGINGALEKYWEQVTNDTLYGSFNNLFESYGGNILEKSAYAIQTYISQYVPAYLRGWQKVTDSKAAVNYQGGWFKATLEKAISAIPFVSGWLLPSKIDPYTGEVDRAYNSIFAAVLNRWLPVTVSVGKKDSVRLEAQALGATTTTATSKFVINDKDYTLSGAEKQQFQSNRARYINTLITDFTKNKTKIRVQQEDGSYKELTYSQMTDEEKQTAFKSYYSKATNYAKIKYWVSSGHKYVTTSRDEYDLLRKLGINATYRINSTGSKYKD